MTQVRVIVVSAEEAYDNNAEFWCDAELMAVTVLHEGRLHLRIDPRADGRPWLIDTTSLALALEEARRQIAAFDRRAYLHAREPARAPAIGHRARAVDQRRSS